MGLAAPKNRSKISNDPQNTNWANNTTRFGHRILESQGWKAGDSLGAQDAAHAAHYTAASQSHIRVFLKDDNLGLGAKRGSERAENFGLAGLESILGRLNGREEDVKKEEARREEVEKRAYVYRKYGFMNFVSGGFLVGDKIQTRDELKKETEAKVEVKSEPESDGAENKKDKKRKRKERDEVQAIVDGAEEEPKLKRKKKSMDLREASKAETDAESGSKKDKKQKRDKKDKDKKKSKKSKTSSASDPEPSAPDAPSPQSDPEPLTDKARRKAEKKVRKEEKKLKKALKKATKAAKSDSSSESEDEETTPSTSVPTSVSATGTSTPVLSTAGLTFSARGMHAVRQRYIRQKKAASMDPQALKEIFMIKTPS